jgi:hypothetical protein
MKKIGMLLAIFVATYASMTKAELPKGLDCEAYYLQLNTFKDGRTFLQVAGQFFNIVGTELGDGTFVSLNSKKTYRDETTDKFFKDFTYAVVTTIDAAENNPSVEVLFEVTYPTGTKEVYAIHRNESFNIKSGFALLREMQVHYTPTWTSDENITVRYTHIGVDCLPSY